jgi:DNA-binding FadR family transcriptional regulator
MESTVKSAQRLANEIEEWVLSEQRHPNELLGNEPELIARFGVSRAVFREAIRMVEFDGLAVMKRGPAGGLMAAEPDGDAVTHALSVYLRYRRTGVSDLYEARLTVEPQCASLAAINLDSRDRATLQAVIDREGDAMERKDYEAFTECVMTFHNAIAALSKNGFYALVVKSLLELTEHLSPWPDYQPDSMAETHHAHLRVAEAVMAGDQALANVRMRSHTRASYEYNASHRSDNRSG